MENNEEKAGTMPKLLQTIYVVANALSFIGLLASIAGYIVSGKEFSHTTLHSIAFATLWLGATYSCVWDPIIRNRKKEVMFWIILTIMTISIPLLVI